MSEADFCSGVYGELQGGGAHGWFVRRAHEALERGLPAFPPPTRILEVGGNLGEHCPYVTHPFATYLVTDYRDTGFRSPDPRISFEVADVQELPYPDNSFDRVVMTCLLHHLSDPEAALRETRRVLTDDAVISIQLPCDPGLAYRASKVVGPYRALKKRGHTGDPRYFHYHQHRNHYPGIVSVINRVFGDDTIRRRWWPFPLPTWNGNLLTVYQVTLCKGDR
jgi:SAM-dependent methyltransferase